MLVWIGVGICVFTLLSIVCLVVISRRNAQLGIAAFKQKNPQLDVGKTIGMVIRQYQITKDEGKAQTVFLVVLPPTITLEELHALQALIATGTGRENVEVEILLIPRLYRGEEAAIRIYLN